jgi:hypothetical protein
MNHLAECAPFLAVVGDDADAAALRRLDRVLDGVGEVRPAGADVRPEDVGAVAFVVRAAGHLTEGSQEDEEQSRGRRKRRRSSRR